MMKQVRSECSLVVDDRLSERHGGVRVIGLMGPDSR